MSTHSGLTMRDSAMPGPPLLVAMANLVATDSFAATVKDVHETYSIGARMGSANLTIPVLHEVLPGGSSKHELCGFKS